MEVFFAYIENISGFIRGGAWNGEQVWHVGPLTALLLLTGVFFRLRLGFLPLRRLFPALGEAWRGRKAQGEGGAIFPIRYIWVGTVFVGAVIADADLMARLGLDDTGSITANLWRLGDIGAASMALPNLISILLMSGTVIGLAKQYGRK